MAGTRFQRVLEATKAVMKLSPTCYGASRAPTGRERQKEEKKDIIMRRMLMSSSEFSSYEKIIRGELRRWLRGW